MQGRRKCMQGCRRNGHSLRLGCLEESGSTRCVPWTALGLTKRHKTRIKKRQHQRTPHWIQLLFGGHHLWKLIVNVLKSIRSILWKRGDLKQLFVTRYVLRMNRQRLRWALRAHFKTHQSTSSQQPQVQPLVSWDGYSRSIRFPTPTALHPLSASFTNSLFFLPRLCLCQGPFVNPAWKNHSFLHWQAHFPQGKPR